MKNHIRFFIDFYLQNGAKMSPKWEGKKWENLALGTLGGQGGPQRAPKAPEEPQSPKNEAQGSPQTPKIDPKRCPETPKWCPSDPPSFQNGAQEAPRTSSRNVRKKPPRSNERTDRRKNNNTTTHHANNPNETARRNARSDPPGIFLLFQTPSPKEKHQVRAFRRAWRLGRRKLRVRTVFYR